MKTHTLRPGPDHAPQILSFSQRFEKRLRSAHPWAARTLIAALLRATGSALDEEQGRHLANILTWSAHLDDKHDQHLALRWLEAGFHLQDCGPEKGLEALDAAARGIFRGPPLEAWGVTTWGTTSLPGPSWFTALGAREAFSPDPKDAVRFGSKEAAVRTLNLMLDFEMLHRERDAYVVQQLPDE